MRSVGRALLVCAAAPQDEPVDLRFSYRDGDKEDVRTEMRMKMTVATQVAEEKNRQSMDVRVSFALRKDCRKAGKDGFEFEGGFADLEMDTRMNDGEQDLKMTVRGKKVRLEGADGEALVDTEKGVNPELAAPILEELKPFDDTVSLELDRRGLLKGLERNEKLREFFQGLGSDKLYPFVLPEKAARPGEKWTHVSELKDLGELKLTGGSIKIPLECGLLRFEGAGAERAAVVSSRIETEIKDVECKGKLGELGGEELTFKIKRLALSGRGETRFLVGPGRVADSSMDMTIAAEISTQLPEDLGGLKVVVSLDLAVGMNVSGGGRPIRRRRDF